MAKHRVQLFNQSRGVEVDTDATPGATVGVNLTLEDGTVVTYDMLFRQPPSDSGDTGAVYWRTIMEVPPNVTALQNTETAGLYVLTGPGGSATRTLTTNTLSLQNASGVAGDPVVDLGELEDAGTGALLAVERDQYGRVAGTKPATITGVEGEVTVEHGDAVGGLPTIGLADVPDQGGGTLQRIQRDGKGRVSGTSEATTDDLPEGGNLYFTDERVDDRVQAADYSLAGAWSFEHNITVAGMTMGLGPGQVATNLAIGSNALAGRTTATNNIAIGSRALESNQTQNNNTAIGANAGLLLTSGTNNTFLGSAAGRDAVSSSASVVVGGNAGQLATALVSAVLVGPNAGREGAGTQPVAIGSSALNLLASGQGNVGVGFQAGGLQTSGTGNVYLGFGSGVTGTTANANLTGSRNTYLGHNCGPGTPTQLTYSSAIGAEAVVTTSNTIVLGRAANEVTVLGATGDDGSGAKLQVTGAIKATSEYRVGANKVVGARDTGWTAIAGTAQKGGGTTYTAPTISNPPTQAEVQAMADALQDAHQKIKALQDALTAHGLIGS